MMSEEQIIDMLLRSGTESDMRIVGLINRMRAEIDRLKAMTGGEKGEESVKSEQDQ